MRRGVWVSGALWLLAGSAVFAQDGGHQFAIHSDFPQARFTVDGQLYYGSATFYWTPGSTHVLQFHTTDDGYQYTGDKGTRFAFENWTDTSGKLPRGDSLVQVVVASKEVSSYYLKLRVEYRVRVQFWNPGGAAPAGPGGCVPPGDTPPSQLRPGVVMIGDICVGQDATLWLQPAEYVLAAYPYPGFAFTGWGMGDGGANAFLRTLMVAGPTNVAAYFQPAKRVRFLTQPRGLQVMVDRAPVPTPSVLPCKEHNIMPPAPPPGVYPLCVGEVDWALGTRHVIGAPTPQWDSQGRMWVFDFFSNKMENHSQYTVESLRPTETITAWFARGVQVSFLTEPSGLKLEVDGRDNWPSYNFAAKAGQTYNISAPAEQTGSDGRRYVFRGWSNGGAASQKITVQPEGATDGFRMTAKYERLSQVLLHSDPAGTPLEVDGKICETPCAVDKPSGTEVRVTAPANRAISHAQRLEFEAWSDGGGRQRTIRVVGSERADLTAGYSMFNLLETSSVPAGGAIFGASPASPDGFYRKDTTVTVTATAKEGYRFRRWGGDLEGTFESGTVVLSAPRSAIAMLDEVTFIPPAGVRNAAGETPEQVVAPGSVISVYGVGLANYPEAGPSYPLPQTLGGTTVRVGERVIALLYASGEQVNAVLPDDLPEGKHTLVVSASGRPEVTGEFTAARNAPGLFSRLIESKLFALASHEDGSPVTPEKPARRGEVVVIYATGLGPYENGYPYGFSLPQAPEFRLVDPVEVVAGDVPVKAAWSGGAAGMAGVQLLKMPITELFPPAATVELRVRVNGHESNKVLLPVE